MIFNDNKIYAKVWKVTPSENGKYVDLQITTSEKDNDGNYVNSSWFPRRKPIRRISRKRNLLLRRLRTLVLGKRRAKKGTV